MPALRWVPVVCFLLFSRLCLAGVSVSNPGEAGGSSSITLSEVSNVAFAVAGGMNWGQITNAMATGDVHAVRFNNGAGGGTSAWAMIAALPLITNVSSVNVQTLDLVLTNAQDLTTPSAIGRLFLRHGYAGTTDNYEMATYDHTRKVADSINLGGHPATYYQPRDTVSNLIFGIDTNRPSTWLTCTAPTQWISLANGYDQSLLATSTPLTLAMSSDWPTNAAHPLSLSLYSTGSIAFDVSTIRSNMAASLSLPATNWNRVLLFRHAFSTNKFEVW